MTTMAFMLCAIFGFLLGIFVGFDLAFKRLITLQYPLVDGIDKLLKRLKEKENVSIDE